MVLAKDIGSTKRQPDVERPGNVTILSHIGDIVERTDRMGGCFVRSLLFVKPKYNASDHGILFSPSQSSPHACSLEITERGSKLWALSTLKIAIFYLPASLSLVEVDTSLFAEWEENKDKGLPTID